MNKLKTFANFALEKFEISQNGERGFEKSIYVSIPTRVSKELRYKIHHENHRLSDPINPVTFVTRISNKYEDFPNQLISREPACSFLIGQYGLGKTELVAQICRFVLKSSEYEAGELIPFPVSLVRCRDDFKFAEKDLGHFLFNHLIQDKEVENEIFYDLMFDNIINGKILLLLDGLDELINISDSNTLQHKWFLNALSNWLKKGVVKRNLSSPKYKLLVSMREEYLSVVSTRNCKEFNEIFSTVFKTNKPSLYFINLGFFDESRVKAYLIKRWNKSKNEYLLRLTEREDFKDLLKDIFHRPLLLKLLADWADFRTSDIDILAEKIKENSHSVFFIQLYIDTIVEEEYQKKLQRDVSECTWDKDLIAKMCLEMSLEGRYDITIDEIRKIIDPPAGKKIEDLTEDEVLKGIHKCPFLIKYFNIENGKRKIIFRFSHKIFFEYFVVSGIKDGLTDNFEKDEFGPFDELVLNVDMRKFLRAFVGDEWYPRTRIAYGLGKRNKEQWSYPEVCGDQPVDIYDDEEYISLDKQRRELLDLMSDPETHMEGDLEGIENTIQTFLAEEFNYHPRYLVPNYESIAVYLWYNSWSVKGKEINHTFEIVIEARAKKILDGLENNNLKIYRAWLLLLERILDVSYRLRFSSIVNLVRKSDGIKTVLNKYKLKNIVKVNEMILRIEVKLEELNNLSN